MREQEKDQGNMGRVANKVAVVTGAASGIGRATAGLLVQEGAAVVLADLDEAAGTLFVGLDVTSEAGWQRLLDATLARHTRLDILVNNAGVQQTKTVEDATLEDFRLHMGVNMDLSRHQACDCDDEGEQAEWRVDRQRRLDLRFGGRGNERPLLR
jgi:3(or 17)beta-hydroxysteroid dehydrogenase